MQRRWPRVLDRPLARPRFNAGVLLLFSVIAVTLTAVGLYGLTAYVVAQRRREVGIRLALGAESRQIVGLFLRRGMLPVLLGAAAGVCISLLGGRVMSSLVYGVATTDAAALVGAVGCLRSSRWPPSSSQPGERLAPIQWWSCGRSRSTLQIGISRHASPV